MSDLPKHRMTALTESAAIAAVPVHVFKIVVVPAAAATTLKLSNDANGAGAAVISSQAAANGSAVELDFEDEGGIVFTASVTQPWQVPAGLLLCGGTRHAQAQTQSRFSE